ncbi:MAG: HEAT repeat domain-containing protein [Elusimicrobiota bacterium]
MWKKKLISIVFGICLFVFQSPNIFTQPPNEKETKNKVKQYCQELEKICKQEKDLNLARQKTIEQMKGLANVSKQSVPYLITEFKNKTKDPKYRYLVFTQLAYTKDEKVIQPAIESLTDKNDEIRGYSAVFLGEMKSKNAVNPLINTLNDENRQIRVAVCSALGKIGDPKAIQPILKRFKKEKDFVARTDFISYSFGKFKDESIYSQLIESLKNDTHPDVRAAAARILGEYGDKKTIESLSDALLNDKHPLVRFYSAIALGNIGGKETIKILNGADKTEKDNLVKTGIKKAIKNIGVK